MLSSRILLAPLAVTLLSLPGCAEEPDPIIGKWQSDPVLSGCNLVHEFEIEDDFEGEGHLVFLVTNVYGYQECQACEIEIEAEPDGGDDYELDYRGGQGCSLNGTIDCELDDDELECVDNSGNQINFERD